MSLQHVLVKLMMWRDILDRTDRQSQEFLVIGCFAESFCWCFVVSRDPVPLKRWAGFSYHDFTQYVQDRNRSKKNSQWWNREMRQHHNEYLEVVSRKTNVLLRYP